MSLRFVRAAGICVTLICCARAARGAKTIVEAPPREPAEELKALHVPPGFEVQLVASEPDIHKPINIAFDDRGRLWVTDTIEYPFPAPEGAKTRDTLKVLEDFDESGKARKITTFADNLNIPVGILPMGDNSALVYSIPYIWKMTDTQGTGHADKRDVILGTIAHDDTHGMTGSFNEGFDGWIYAVHGFKNTSTLKASDGSSITLNSGNTYRFKRDGSHVEQFTHGQVNPFGMCFDPQGNLFTSDCETMPIALMLREAYYPSFGKPDDGLGFAPDVCDHMYGSTAIAGLCDYVAEQFPEEYRNRMLVGNVVTNRINNAKLTPRGSGFHGDDMPDFLVSDDGWFRPTCIKLGPDGAIYVTDFYNRIIGHYEVDLHHPGRDKQRGRIWRIVYKGPGTTPTPSSFDLTKQSVQQVVDDLANPNMTIRMLAMNRLADTIGQPAIAPLTEAVARPKNPFQKVHAMWDLYRLGALEPATLESAAKDPESLVRIHAMRILGEKPKWESGEHDLAMQGLKDADPSVRRAAADALGRHPQPENVRALLDTGHQAGNDRFLQHVIKISLRDQLQDESVGKRVLALQWSEADQRQLAEAALGASSPQAASLLLKHVRTTSEPREVLAKYARAIARSVPEDQVDELATFISEKFASDVDLQLTSFKSVLDGLAQRGVTPGQATRRWGEGLAEKIIHDEMQHREAWTYLPVEGSTESKSPWGAQMRASADGNRSSPFLSSLVDGETLTGVAKSPTFIIPPKLSFYIAGHNGKPPTKFPMKNVVRLRDAQTGEVLAEQAPPRNDTAQRVTWDLEKFAGRQGYFEATDGDNGKAYAWLAFGRFDPPVISVPASGPRLVAALQIVESLHLTSLGGDAEMLLASSFDRDARTAAVKALAGLGASAHVPALASVIRDASVPDKVRETAADALGAVDSADASAVLVDAVHAAPMRLQYAFAKALAVSPGGANALLNAIHDGKASPRLLLDSNVTERLKVARVENLDKRIAELTKGLPAVDVEVQMLIDRRAAQFNPRKADAARGKAVFQKNCMVCHMVGGQGAHVGPQLDGIGVRGVPRLCEDILDPSRNVDAAFRYSTFVLNDGNVIAGIPRREEGQTITVADSTGKEVTIDKTKITRRVESQLSLMPSNFGEVIPQNDFNDLMSYLLSTKQK